MTNWVDHRLTITGPEAELKRFANCFVKATGSERFPAIVERKFDIDVPRPEGEVFFSFEKLSPPRPEDWDRWALARWGFKHVAVDAKIETDGDALKFSFETAWSPKFAIYEELAELFPLLTMDGDYCEYGYSIAGDVRCHGGKFTHVDKSEEFKAKMEAMFDEEDRARKSELAIPAGEGLERTVDDSIPTDDEVPF